MLSYLDECVVPKTGVHNPLVDPKGLHTNHEGHQETVRDCHNLLDSLLLTCITVDICIP